MSLFTHRWTRSGQLAIVRDMTELSTIIIGSGPAGYTAAIYLARAGYRPTILAGELTPGGQLVNTTTVENYPGFPDGILGPELMDRMRDQAESFGASIEYLDVTSVDFSSSPKTVTCSDGSQYHADAVIITTGSQYRKLGIPGEAEYSGHGVSYCATCDGFFFKDKPIVVVGGGDSALEEALLLTRFGSSVTVLHRRDQFRASKIMVERVLNNPKITVKMNTVATAIRGQKNAAGAQTGADAVTAAAPAAQNTGNLLSLKTTPMLNVSGSALNAPSSTGISLSAKAETADDSAGFVDIRDTVTGETGTLPAEGIFVAIGHEPATRFASMARIRLSSFFTSSSGSFSSARMRSTRFLRPEEINTRKASSTITSEHLPMMTQGPWFASWRMIFDWITKS